MSTRPPANPPVREYGTASRSNNPAKSATVTFAGDRRDQARLLCGGPIWWKNFEADSYEQGWLIERADDGVAFLARGSQMMVEGERILVSTSDPTDVGFRTQEGFVSRTTHVHADLHLIAAQLKPRIDRAV